MTQADRKKAFDIFFPHAVNREQAIQRDGHRFVYYTSAETAMAIFRNQEIWMRNPRNMNDFAEIERGVSFVRTCLESAAGQELKSLLQRFAPSKHDALLSEVNTRTLVARWGTFVTCFSEHPDHESTLGRLSMWRAYGRRNGVALVIKKNAFLDANADVNVPTSPVAYFTERQFEDEFARVVEGVSSNIELFEEQDPDYVYTLAIEMLTFAMFCTKHPGFQEEREWRAIYTPHIRPSQYVKVEVESIAEVPQLVAKFPLKDASDGGIPNLSLLTLIDEILIGPCSQPDIIMQAFVELMALRGFENPTEKVKLSNIPLRP